MGNEAIEIEVDVLSNPPDWSLTEFNNFQSTMSIIGELNFESDISTDTNDIIGAFMENENGLWECRGIANLESVPYISGHPYQVFLSIYSDLEDPLRNSSSERSSRSEDEIRFRLWDNSDNKEYYQIDHSVFGGTLMFSSNEVYGTPMSPVSLSTVTDLVQDIQILSGWTWFSTNLALDPNTLDDVLVSLNPLDNNYIKNQTQYAQYSDNQWVGSLTTMNNTSMYKIKLSEAQNLEIVGELRDPFFTTFSYNSGWNWIGFIPHVSMSVNQAMGDRINTTGDFIKNQSGYAFYVDESSGWIGSLRFMNPGEGFMLYSSASGSFEYPEYDIRFDDSIYPTLDPLLLRDAPDWSVEPENFEYTGSVTIEFINASNGNYMVGSFVGEDCRGSVTPIEIGGRWLYFLTVFSNTQNEEIHLMVYDGNSDEIIDPGNLFTFTTDMILGSPSNPYEVEIMGTLLVPQNVIISSDGSIAQITWDEVAEADSYRVFACDSPDGIFVDVTSSGTFGVTRDLIRNDDASVKRESTRFYAPKGERLESRNPVSSTQASQRVKSATRARTTKTWTAPVDGTTKFYYVKASTDHQRE